MLAAALIGGGVQQALAQPAGASGRGMVIEEVVVTARRRDERLQDVPAAVNVLDRAMLERYAVEDVQSVAHMTPHLIVNSGGASSGTQMYLRGIGSSGNVGFDQALGLVIDGVYYSRGRWIKQGFLDMERVEVLKGPQALYFGKNTPAGVISITTAGPGETFEGYARAGYEQFSREWIGEAVLSGPLTDQFGARLAIRGSRMDGFMKNDAGPRVGVDPLGLTLPGASSSRSPEEREYSGRLTLQWDPRDDLSATLKLAATSFEDDGPAGKYELGACQGPNGTAQGVFGASTVDDCSVNGHSWRTDMPRELAANDPQLRRGQMFTDYESQSLSLNVEWELDRYLLTSVTGYNQYDIAYNDNFDYSSAGQIYAFESVDNDAISQEFRLLSRFEGPVNFMAGVYYQETDFKYRNSSRIAPLPADPVTGRFFSWDRPQTQKGESWSAFGELLWDIVDDVELSVGARYSKEKKDSTSRNEFIHTFLAANFSTALFADNFRDSNWSPQATLTWRPMPELTVYGAFKTGFKAGGFSHQGVLLTQTTVDELIYGSETAEGFEGGVRTTLLDGMLRMNLTGYHYVFDDLQVNAFNAATTSFTVQNAAELTTKGVEADFEWLATEQLMLRGNLAYNNARYDEFFGTCYAGQTQEQGCNQQINPITGVARTQDLSGERPPLAPDWNLGLGFTYETELTNRLDFSLSTDVRYSSQYETGDQNRPDLRQDSYYTVDAAARILTRDGRLEFALIGRNLGNEKIVTSGRDRPGTGGAPGLAAADPASGQLSDGAFLISRLREVLLQATYRF